MSRYTILGAARAIFTLEKMLAMSNVLEAMKKKRLCVGASCSFLLLCLRPVRLVSDRYPNKDKRGVLGGIIITQTEVITVTRRDQLCISMKYEDFGDHKSDPMPVRLLFMQLLDRI